jgi:hypothetical protein
MKLYKRRPKYALPEISVVLTLEEEWVWLNINWIWIGGGALLIVSSS